MATRKSTTKNQPSTRTILFAVIGIFALLLSVGTAAYFIGNGNKETRTIVRTNTIQPTATQQQVEDCDDGNIVGMALGGVAGGLLGNQVGKGSGNTAATIGGTVGGAYLGKDHIPTRNVTCR